METDGRQGDEGRDGTDPPSNVVQFPRDWFGPKDELVPFGPRADESGVVEVEAPVRPDDFWGEGSAAIHDVLRAPKVVEGGDSSAVAYRRARRHVSAARLPQLRLVRLLAGALALVVCSAALVGRFEGAGTALRASARAKVGGGAALRGGAPDPRDSTWRRAALFLALRRTSPLKGVSGSRRQHATRPQPGGANPSGSAAAGTPASIYVSTPVSPSSAPVAQAAAGAPSSGSSSGRVSASAGPQGPGAPFGPGHLG